MEQEREKIMMYYCTHTTHTYDQSNNLFDSIIFNLLIELCDVVLCCAMLCYVVLCCAVLCCAVGENIIDDKRMYS